MLKSKKYFFLCSFLCCHLLSSQGFFNNGARVVFNGAAFMYINGAAGNFSNTSGGLVTPSQTSTILLQGSWINNAANAVFTADGGTVILDGSVGTQNIGGTNPTAFTHLRLIGTNNASLAVNNVTVGGATSFTGSLHIDNRPFILNSNTLIHTNGAGTSISRNNAGRLVSETNAAVNPSILRWYVRTTTGMHEVPFGTMDASDNIIPLGFNITTAMTNAAGYVDFSTRRTLTSDNQPWPGASNVGAVTFMYCPNIPLTGNPCAVNSAIDRWWDISNSNPVTADLTFRYRGVENTLNAPYNSGNIGAQFWTGSLWDQNNATYGSAPAVPSGTGAVTATGIGTFCPWVLSSVSVPLPVELLDVKMECSGKEKNIYWSTLSESQMLLFEIQASKDGSNFTKIGEVPANGNSNQIRNYQYSIKPEHSNYSLFRVRCIDVNFNAKNSKTVTAPESCSKNDVNIYYYPETGIVVNAVMAAPGPVKMSLFDVSGKLIVFQHSEMEKGYNQKIWKPDLAEGVYVLQVEINNTKQFLKIPYRN